MPRSSESRPFQEKPLRSGHVRYEAPPPRIKIGNLHEEEITFLVLEGPTVGIILGPPGSSSTLQRSDGTPARWFAGANFATKTVLLNFHVYSTRHWPSRLPPHKLSPVLLPPSHLIMWRSRMSSASRQPPNFYPIGHGTVPSTCCLETNSRRVEYIRCPSRSARLWRSTWRRTLNQGSIRPSSSLATSSFFFVGKKDRGLQPCIDYRALNSQTIKLPYLLLLVSAALEELRGARIFSKLDLQSAYNLVRIRKGDEWKTAFITPTGHYEYLVMPVWPHLSSRNSWTRCFGSSSIPSVIVYIDDIFIYSRNLVDHRHHVRQVLHLYLKLEKCEFHHSTVQFLGYIIGQEGIQLDQGRVTAITEWPIPQPVKELQRFLGFANFIKDFRLHKAPLTSMLRGKPKSLSWNTSAQEAFEELNRILSQQLSEPPCLQPLAKLWYRKSWVARHQAGIGIVAALAGTSQLPIQHHYRPQKHSVSPWSQETQPSPTALETTEQLFTHVSRSFGIPEDIVSDRGPKCISHMWKAFFHLLGVTVSLSSGYHPQTNGQAERKIQELGRYLRAYCQVDQYSWSCFLPWA